MVGTPSDRPDSSAPGPTLDELLAQVLGADGDSNDDQAADKPDEPDPSAAEVGDLEMEAFLDDACDIGDNMTRSGDSRIAHLIRVIPIDLRTDFSRALEGIESYQQARAAIVEMARMVIRDRTRLVFIDEIREGDDVIESHVEFVRNLVRIFREHGFNLRPVVRDVFLSYIAKGHFAFVVDLCTRFFRKDRSLIRDIFSFLMHRAMGELARDFYHAFPDYKNDFDTIIRVRSRMGALRKPFLRGGLLSELFDFNPLVLADRPHSTGIENSANVASRLRLAEKRYGPKIHVDEGAQAKLRVDE